MPKNAYAIKRESVEALQKSPNDRYHQNRVLAANFMIENGRSEWVYLTQWASGNQMWANPVVEGLTVIVAPGEVTKIVRR